MGKEKYAYVTYRNLYLFAELIIGIKEIVVYNTNGAASFQPSIGRLLMAAILIVHCFTICLMIPLLKKAKAIRITYNMMPRYKFTFHNKRIHWFMFFLFIVEIIFTLRSGNARLFATVNSSISFLFNLFRPAVFMPIYYVAARDLKKPLYWINILLYMVYQVICGWSGFILTVFFLELFLYLKNRKINKAVLLMCQLNWLFVVCLIFAGAFVYSYAYSMKMSVRMGYGFSQLEFIDALTKLVSRLTNYSDSVVAFQNHSRIAELYREQGIWAAEVLSIFKSVLPRFIMPNKEFRALTNIVWQSIWPDISNATGTGYNSLIYFGNILEADFGCFILSILTALILFICTKKFLYAFDSGNGDMDIVFFLYAAQICTGTGMTNIAGYFPVIYMVPFMILVGVIKIRNVHVLPVRSGISGIYVEGST